MKKFSVFLCTLALVFGITGISYAIPMNYTFGSGSQTWVIGIDLNANGFMTQFNGNVLPKTDTSILDFFYADYVSGPLASGAGVYTNLTDIQEYNFGYQRSDSTDYGMIQVGSADSYLTIYAPLDVSDWVAGTTTVRIQNRFTDSSSASGITISTFQNVVLTAKSAAVPEPATMLLLGSGLLGLAAVGRRKFFKK